MTVAFILARALVYATLFIGFLLVFLPARIVARSGLPAPEQLGGMQVVGLIVGAAGAVLAGSCILAFVLVGQGTPAPFDPPRRLVVRGPYRWVRNPMYLGAGAMLLGAASYYESWPLLLYATIFLFVMRLLVVFSEEPVLRDKFGSEYDAYCQRVGRWWPRRRGGAPNPPPSGPLAMVAAIQFLAAFLAPQAGAQARDLGTIISFSTSSASPAAQAAFEQGAVALHSFWRPVARQAFQEEARAFLDTAQRGTGGGPSGR